MANGYIDIQTACMEGLMIVAEKCSAFGHDHHKYMDAARKEKAHLEKCTVCNPALLAEDLFKQPVSILREVAR